MVSPDGRSTPGTVSAGMGSGLRRCPPDARRKLRFERNELVQLNVAQAVVGMLLVPSRHQHQGCRRACPRRHAFAATAIAADARTLPLAGLPAKSYG